jgi:hypothetical protein
VPVGSQRGGDARCKGAAPELADPIGVEAARIRELRASKNARRRLRFGHPRDAATIDERSRPGDMGQGVRLLERPEDRFIDTLRQRPYSVLIFSSLSRLAVMDSSTELVPLIHAPPSSRSSSEKGP